MYNCNEMKAFLSIILVVGYHILPSSRDYWFTQNYMTLKNIMTLYRIDEIRASLYFADNLMQLSRNDMNYDRTSKIRQILNHFYSAFGKNNLLKVNIFILINSYTIN